MKTDTMKDATYYKGLPYTITIRKDDEGDFVARIPELPGCIAHGESEAAAIENLRTVQRFWIEEALAARSAIPEPEDDKGLPSGKWVQRVPRRLHRDLVNAARRDNVSLNQLVTSMLSESLAMKSCTHAFQIFLSHGHQPIAPINVTADFFSLAWPAEAASERGYWSILHGTQSSESTESHMRVGNIMQSLARIKSLTPSIFPDEPYADEHRESHKRLARK
jgi:predicted RNase H-like HicB family nuclease